ncbi:hypothetical protein CYY_007366 [Polysphondylium violaceum]|uniref:Pleckstrin domain-containing protein n=1 Tax=Polysphondylium violaceum TaxID=133409 RepID=A0A8J4PQX1_9MYCE|nr:hypothetical protein CYY_007366 [Polysphondylium violaceum]
MVDIVNTIQLGDTTTTATTSSSSSSDVANMAPVTQQQAAIDHHQHEHEDYRDFSSSRSSSSSSLHFPSSSSELKNININNSDNSNNFFDNLVHMKNKANGGGGNSSSINNNSNSPPSQQPLTPEEMNMKRPMISPTIQNEKNINNTGSSPGTAHSNIDSFSPKLNAKNINHSLRKKTSRIPCIVITLMEIILGAATIFPLIIGILDKNIPLLIYGSFGVLFLLFGVVGFFSLLFSKPKYLKLFYFWKYISIVVIVLITIAIGLLSKYNKPLVSSWWASVILIIGIAILFIAWTATCILWIQPFMKEIRSLESMVLKEIDEENIKDNNSEIEVELLDQITPKPQYGFIQPEDPLRIAIRKFNKNPENGFNYINENNLLSQTNYKDIVTFLYNVDELNKVKVGEFLGGNSESNKRILQQFVSEYNFVAKEFDESLREFLSKFRLPGEAQKIDRIMESFAMKYHKDNPQIFSDPDSAYLLAFSLILLNTDAHNPAIKNKMTKKSFVQNNTGFKGKKDLPIEYLEKLYDRIINNELKMDSDSLFSNAQIEGWLSKMTSNQKKWQKRWFVLKNNCLYYFKNEKDQENPKAIIPLEGLKVTQITDFIFEIEDSTVGTIKSVKLTPTGPVEGQHEKYQLKAFSIEDSKKWINSIRNNVLGSPVLLLIKKKKKILARHQSDRNGNSRRKSFIDSNSNSINSSGSHVQNNNNNNNTTTTTTTTTTTSTNNLDNNNGKQSFSNRSRRESMAPSESTVSRENHHHHDYEMSPNASLKSYDDFLTEDYDEFHNKQSKQTENEFLF